MKIKEFVNDYMGTAINPLPIMVDPRPEACVPEPILLRGYGDVSGIVVSEAWLQKKLPATMIAARLLGRHPGGYGDLIQHWPVVEAEANSEPLTVYSK